MDAYYDCAIVFDSVIVWWTESDGKRNVRWLEGDQARVVIELADTVESQIQTILRAAVGGN